MRRAFTLVELLVVIGIIAILAAILFPVFAQSKLQAKKATSLSNVRQLVVADLLYRSEHDGSFVGVSYYKLHTLVTEPVLRKPYGYTLTTYYTPEDDTRDEISGLKESMFDDLTVLPLYCSAYKIRVDLLYATGIEWPYAGHTVAGYADGHSKTSKPSRFWHNKPSLTFPPPTWVVYEGEGSPH
jgi:prepilin-type N-terminal cleavage/methylation domain-containing protein